MSGTKRRRGVVHQHPGDRAPADCAVISRETSREEALREITSQEANLKRAAEEETASVISKAMKRTATQGKGEPCSASQQAIHEQVRKVASKIVDDITKKAETQNTTAAMRNTTAKAESTHRNPSFSDTTPGRLSIDFVETIPPEDDDGGGEGSGGGGYTYPRGSGGFGSGSNGSNLTIPPQYRWMVATFVMLCLLAGFVFVFVAKDMSKEDAQKALALVRGLVIDVKELSQDMSIGATQLELNKKKLNEVRDDVTGQGIALQSVRKDVIDVKDSLTKNESAVKTFLGIVGDPQSLVDNASKVTHLEGDIKSLKRSDSKVASDVAKANNNADQAQNSVAELRAKVISIEDKVATLAKAQAQGGVSPEVKGMQIPSKGPYAGNIRLSSMEYMDGGGKRGASSISQETVGEAKQSAEIKNLASRAKKYYTNTNIPFTHLDDDDD